MTYPRGSIKVQCLDSVKGLYQDPIDTKVLSFDSVEKLPSGEAG